jgi:putative addiction module CopG family antidote
MQIQLTPQIESIVKALLETGEYQDQDEVIAEAILLLEDERKLRALRADLAEAEEEIARGDFVVWTPELREELRREARQMVAEGRKPHPDVCP